MPALTLPPIFPPSSSVTVACWLKKVGEAVVPGEVIVELEGEETTLQVESECAGRLVEILATPGKTVRSGDSLARIDVAADTKQSNTVPQVSKETQVSKPTETVSGKVTPVLMPQAGNTMEEGTVISWRVKPGEQVAVGQILCEIETDKATMDFESPDAGRMARIVAKEGEPVAVKGLIALLADNDTDADAYLSGQCHTSSNSTFNLAQLSAAGASSTSTNGSSATRTPAPTPVSAEGRIKASPAARRLAAERGIELSNIGAGSGPGGRILSGDLPAATTMSAPAAAQSNGGEVRRPLSKMRRAIGLNLQQSKQTVPHFYVRATIDADPLLALYREQKTTANCTLNDIIILAVGRAIREFSAVRSQIVGNEIVEYPHANIGIAVGVDDGLVVPVITDVDTLSLASLAAETKRVVEAARKGRLENIGKGHFTISNLGMFGVEEFSAIINPPESGILAVSAAREAVIVENGAMRAGRNMTLTLSADHRLIDGVMAAKFMQRLREILEHPAAALG